MSTIPPESSDKPHVEIDTQNCSLTPQEAAKVDESLGPLRRVVDRFPVADLYITIIRHPRSQDVHVKTSLILPGRTLFTGDRAAELLTAYLRCVRKLVRKVEAYKADLESEAEVRKEQKGTLQDVVAEQPADYDEISKAVEAGDYAAFRRATIMYEDPVSLRAGRWIKRFPEAEVRLGTDLTLGDVVEEVFLNAFEDFDHRPDNERFGDWLENLIDPSLRALLEREDEEFRNVSFARTLRETENE